MTREKNPEDVLRNLSNLLDNAFGGINLTEEIIRYERKYNKSNGPKKTYEDVIDLVRKVSI